MRTAEVDEIYRSDDLQDEKRGGDDREDGRQSSAAGERVDERSRREMPRAEARDPPSLGDAAARMYKVS